MLIAGGQITEAQIKHTRVPGYWSTDRERQVEASLRRREWTRDGRVEKERKPRERTGPHERIRYTGPDWGGPRYLSSAVQQGDFDLRLLSFFRAHLNNTGAQSRGARIARIARNSGVEPFYRRTMLSWKCCFC